MNGAIEIGICFILVLVCSAISWRKKQNMEKDFLIGGIRVVLQLILLGYFLNWIFKHNTILIIALASVIMTFNSALHSKNRIEVRHPGLLVDNLFATALAIWPLAFLGAALLHNEPLWDVRVFLPLLGMLLGNTMNGMALGVNFFSVELKSRKEEVMSLLALGATPKEATEHIRNRALKIAMTPTLNSQASMGVVSIPGMMTGQILGGTSPEEAAYTQIIMMLLITIGTYAGTYSSLYFARKKKFLEDGVPCFE